VKDFLPYLFDLKAEVTNTKDPDRREAFFAKLAWDTNKCVEAEKVFPDMLKCPVCLEMAERLDDQLVIRHKHSKMIWN